MSVWGIGGELWCVLNGGENERTDDELFDSELFHGVGWGRLLFGLGGAVECATRDI